MPALMPEMPAGPQLADNQTLSVGISFVAPTMDPHLSTTGTVRRQRPSYCFPLTSGAGAP